MANNIQKYIDVTGTLKSVRLIKLATEVAQLQPLEDGSVDFGLALEKMGCDRVAADRHGWAKLTNVEICEPHGYNIQVLSMHVLTPYASFIAAMTRTKRTTTTNQERSVKTAPYCLTNKTSTS
jgi:hypothetical protein